MSWQLKQKLQKTVADEIGAQIFAPGSRRPFALVYPNTYRVGMSNLGFQIIYQQINSRGDTACERLFLPDRKTEQEYVRTNTPLLTMETQRSLADFPLIGFAVSFEMDYFNILKILDMAKISLLATERNEQDPLIIIGGPCATFNPEPLADFVDICVIGEGEEVINEILDVYYQGQANSKSKEDILLALASLDGVYVPKFYQPEYNEDGTIAGYQRLASVPPRVKRRWIKNLDNFKGQTVIVTDDTEFDDMYLLEIARGCGRHCRFCMAGYCFRRPRVRALTDLKQIVTEAKRYRDKIGLVGAAISDYPEIDELAGFIIAQGLKLSVASLRADSLTDKLVSALAASGHKTVTLAPEAAGERMRRIINKGINSDDVEGAVEMIIKAGIPNIRLYFMVGLPFETPSEQTEIVAMACRIKRLMEKCGSNGKLTLSINPFIPKPFTPFERMPMADYDYVEHCLKNIKTALKAKRGIEVLVESPKEAYMQSILARGDRYIGKLLLRAHLLGGSKAWRQACKETKTDDNFYLYRERGNDEVLPWTNLDMGVEKNYLEAEFIAASQEKVTPACFEGCIRCGVCKQ